MKDIKFKYNLAAILADLHGGYLSYACSDFPADMQSSFRNTNVDKFIKDIVDIYYGNAKFPDKLVRIRLIPESSKGYLKYDHLLDSFTAGSIFSKVVTPEDDMSGYTTVFSKQWIENNYPEYVPFIEELNEADTNMTNKFINTIMKWLSNSKLTKKKD